MALSIDSSKGELKAVPLYSGNKYPFGCFGSLSQHEGCKTQRKCQYNRRTVDQPDNEQRFAIWWITWNTKFSCNSTQPIRENTPRGLAGMNNMMAGGLHTKTNVKRDHSEVMYK